MTEMPQNPTDTAALTYEQARDELVAIVRKLETGSAPLEETLALWERGEELAQRCQQILSEAQKRLERATQPSQSAE